MGTVCRSAYMLELHKSIIYGSNKYLLNSAKHAVFILKLSNSASGSN